MIKKIAFTAAALFCVAAAAFNIFAAFQILHTVDGWRVVQVGVLFVAFCYGVAACGFTFKAVRN